MRALDAPNCALRNALFITSGLWAVLIQIHHSSDIDSADTSCLCLRPHFFLKFSFLPYNAALALVVTGVRCGGRASSGVGEERRASDASLSALRPSLHSYE